MKSHNSIFLRTALIAIILFIAGKLVFFRLFGLFEPAIDGILFQITERPGKYPTSLLFSLMMSFIPVMVAFIWQLGPVVSTGRRASVVATIVLFMCVGIFVRHYQVKNYFIGVVRPFLLAKNQLPMQYPIDPANFVYYMFGGCCIGCILSFLLFSQKKYSQPALN